MIFGARVAFADAPPNSDYCQRLQHGIQGKKHGFFAGNVTYYAGRFHASREPKEHETLGLTHPSRHDLRSRGVGLVQSHGKDPDDTGLSNDFSEWEFYRDTRVLYGSLLIDGKIHRHPVPRKMYWRPDRMVREYEVDGVALVTPEPAELRPEPNDHAFRRGLNLRRFNTRPTHRRSINLIHDVSESSSQDAVKMMTSSI